MGKTHICEKWHPPTGVSAVYGVFFFKYICWEVEILWRPARFKKKTTNLPFPWKGNGCEHNMKLWQVARSPLLCTLLRYFLAGFCYFLRSCLKFSGGYSYLGSIPVPCFLRIESTFLCPEFSYFLFYFGNSFNFTHSCCINKFTSAVCFSQASPLCSRLLLCV